MVDVSIQEAYEEACRALGEANVVVRLQSKQIVELNARISDLEQSIGNRSNVSVGN